MLSAPQLLASRKGYFEGISSPAGQRGVDFHRGISGGDSQVAQYTAGDVLLPIEPREFHEPQEPCMWVQEGHQEISVHIQWRIQRGFIGFH